MVFSIISLFTQSSVHEAVGLGNVSYFHPQSILHFCKGRQRIAGQLFELLRPHRGSGRPTRPISAVTLCADPGALVPGASVYWVVPVGKA